MSCSSPVRSNGIACRKKQRRSASSSAALRCAARCGVVYFDDLPECRIVGVPVHCTQYRKHLLVPDSRGHRQNQTRACIPRAAERRRSTVVPAAHDGAVSAQRGDRPRRYRPSPAGQASGRHVMHSSWSWSASVKSARRFSPDSSGSTIREIRCSLRAFAICHGQPQR